MSFTLAEEQKKVEQIVDSVFQVLVDGSKQDYIGEKISQLEHSLQAAASAQNASELLLFTTGKTTGLVLFIFSLDVCRC
jgi:predicted HD phosphohydrolase